MMQHILCAIYIYMYSVHTAHTSMLLNTVMQLRNLPSISSDLLFCCFMALVSYIQLQKLSVLSIKVSLVAAY